MPRINRTSVADFRGATRLAFDATLGITALVEKMHHTIQLVHPPLGTSRADVTGGLTGLIYRAIRGTTRIIGKGIDAGLAPVAALLPEGESNAARDAWVAALNGVYGDHLERTANPLAIEMGFRHDGKAVDPRDPAVVVTEVSRKLMVVIHGLCLSDQNWSREGHNRLEAMARETGHTVIYVRYNSGRSIESNGRSLAGLLEPLLENWPSPETELVIVGHSMGGLVARSAMHFGSLACHEWRKSLRQVFSLGTPHHGAPLERGGHRLDGLLELSPYVAPFTSLGKARSAGISDLRHGDITGVAQEFVQLPDDVECYALAATLGKKRSLLAERLIGDGLVPLDSALGQHAEASRTLALPQERQWIGYEMSHLELLGRPEVFSQLGKWLR